MSVGYFCCILYFTTAFLVTGVSSLIQASYGGICLNECDFRGESYTYCKTTRDRWDYCSNIDQVTKSGKLCRENHECGFHKERYLWCYTDNLWDYCSLYRNEAVVASDGRICREDHPCGKHGYSYYWCYTTGSKDWHYCNLKKITVNEYLTRYGYHCKDSCKEKDQQGYNTCTTIDGTSGYCSSKSGFTYRGDKCEVSHPCDKYGKTYFWCYKQHGSWDYCSPIENCGYWPPTSSHRVKRQSVGNVCRIPTALHNVDIVMEDSDQRPGRLENVTEKQRRQVQILIEKLSITSVDANAQKTLCKDGPYRIDLQGTFTNKNNQKMANIQVQSNGPNSRSVAAILIPMNVDFAVRYIRRALLRSLDSCRIITMDINRNSK